jgi:Dyp-type peroxidase family
MIATTRHVADFNRKFSKALHELGRDPDLKALWVNVSLTYQGLLALDSSLGADLGRYPAFRSGPAGDREGEAGARTTTAALLGDVDASDPRHWVFGRREAEPHALLTIAADDADELKSRREMEEERARRYGLDVLRTEVGSALTDDLKGREHFGFKDGISQPGLRGFTTSVLRRGRMEDAEHPGSPIIASGEFVLGRVPERRGYGPVPPPAPEWMWGGSFQVFRRLTQDVPLWNQEMARLGHPLTAEQLAAKAVGRHPDGRPLRPGGQLGDNDFDYEDDDLGYDTPRFAHIRKMNPRNHRVFGDRTHRILRRGITFVAPNDANQPAGQGERTERGLLFNAFMASIEEQFEFLQRAWANNPAFPSVVLDPPEKATEDGADPVVGAATSPCLLRVKGCEDRSLDFKRFVHTTGAVYAFAPSLLTLRGLAAQGAAAARSKDATQLVGYPAAR